MTQPASKRLLTEATGDPKVASRAAGTGATVRREFADANRTASKWREVHGTADFSGTKDPVMFIGWNADRGLAGGDAGEGAIYLGLEAHYRVDIGGLTDTMEAYFDVRPNSATDGSYATFRPFALTAGKASTDRWAQVQIDIGTGGSATRNQFNLQAGGAKNLLHIDDSGTSALYVPLLIATTQGGNGLKFDSSATGNAYVDFGALGTAEMRLIRYQGDGNFYIWNLSNGRAHVTFTRGSTDTTAVTEFSSNVKVKGNVGFYGGTPAAKPTVTGSKGANAALTSLLTALAGLGLLTDSSS